MCVWVCVTTHPCEVRGLCESAMCVCLPLVWGKPYCYPQPYSPTLNLPRSDHTHTPVPKHPCPNPLMHPCVLSGSAVDRHTQHNRWFKSNRTWSWCSDLSMWILCLSNPFSLSLVLSQMANPGGDYLPFSCWWPWWFWRIPDWSFGDKEVIGGVFSAQQRVFVSFRYKWAF